VCVCVCVCVCSSIRVHVRSSALFVRQVEDDFQRITAHFHTLPRLVNSSTPLDVDAILSSLNTQVENFNYRGSGFTLEYITKFVLIITRYRPMHGRSYIPTPTFLLGKHCIVNVKNNDDKCFLWAILSCLFEPTQNKERISNYYQYERSVNVQGLNFPITPKDIPVFENLNPEIGINLYTIDENNGFCIEYVSPHRNRLHSINLLLIEDHKSGKNTIHGSAIFLQ